MWNRDKRWCTLSRLIKLLAPNNLAHLLELISQLQMLNRKLVYSYT